jgi:hypothetical protein
VKQGGRLGGAVTSMMTWQGPASGSNRPDVLSGGREREQYLLEGLARAAEGGVASLVGDGGVSAMAVLPPVAEVASNRACLRVPRARGGESEAVREFAVIADVLLPRTRFSLRCRRPGE